MTSGVNGLAVERLITNACVLTMDAERRVLSPGYVATTGSLITQVGSGAHPEGVTAQEVIDAEGGVCHPGLIDAHAHVSWGLVRCAVPESLSEEQIFCLFDERMLARVEDEDEHLGAELACVEMVMNGTTCFADTGSALHALAPTAEAVERVGIRGMISLLVGDAADGVPALSQPLDLCLERAEEGLRQHPKSEALVWACVGLVGMETATDRLVREAKTLADNAGVPLNMHKSFSRDEVVSCRRRLAGGDPLLGFDALEVLDQNLMLVHVNYCSGPEADLLVTSGASVVHCPTASMMYAVGGSRHGRFPELVDRGVPVALGTDSTHWCNAWDLTRSAYLAAAMHKEAAEERPAIAAETALEMATVHGAQAVGRAHELGSIEPGKRADLVIHGRARPEAHPAFDPVTSLVFSGQSKTVRTVIVDGVIVVEDGAPTRVDLEALFAEVEKRAAALLERLEYTPPRRWHVEVPA